MAKSDQGALFGYAPDGQKLGPGPVYQGVCKQIRTMTKAGTLDANTQAGLIAQARALGRALDRANGHGGTAEYGQSVAALSAELSDLLDRMGGGGAASDPFQKLLEDLADAPLEPAPGDR